MKKRIVLTVLLSVLFVTNTIAQIKVSGQLVDNKAIPVEFANIALQSADQFQGTVSDDKGTFEMQVLPGSYQLKISAIGYDTYETELTVQSDHIDLGEVLLPESSINIDEVVVRADRVVRKADRFIVNLMNDPTVFGKSGTEILNQSPGIFIQKRDGIISINGKTGTRVYVNERPLHETGTDLVRYLQTLKAEDIMRIEIVPLAGADYDADITGGVIKITLKRLRNNGINGSIGSFYSFTPGENVSSFGPSFNMNYRNNRLSMYTALNFDESRHVEHVTEEVHTLSMDRTAHSTFAFPVKPRTTRARLGGVYDLDDRQSIGVEGYYSHGSRKNGSTGTLTEIVAGNRTDITSVYDGKNIVDNYSVSANYMLQLDSLGSMFKVLLDYHHNESDDNQHYNSEFRGYMNYDTIYRSDMTTQNDLYAASADLSLRLNDYTTLSTGLKYVHNEMNTGTLFEYRRGTAWNEIEPYTNAGAFSEDIAAVFASLSSRLKNISYSIGLRGEYTYIEPWSDKSDQTKKQSYFKLFPTVNVMMPLGGNGAHSVVLNYNRKIQRPGFSYLNPFRMPGSEYLFIEGNPNLQAIVPDDYSISLRLFNRFNVTAGITNIKNGIETITNTNSDAPNVLIQRMENIGRKTTYYLGVNASLKPFEWWQININLAGQQQDLTIYDVKRSNKNLSGYMSHTFILPKEYMFDINGFYMSPGLVGNMKMKMSPRINASVRKQFFNKKLNTSLFVNNIFNKKTLHFTTEEKDFHRELTVDVNFREIGISLSYNFSVGKSINVKNVETGAADEKARMQ